MFFCCFCYDFFGKERKSLRKDGWKGIYGCYKILSRLLKEFCGILRVIYLMGLIVVIFFEVNCICGCK